MDRLSEKRRVFHLLDAIRGVAAIAVTQRHMAINMHLPNTGSYLAVDLFFVLSGFVIAHAYSAKLLNGEPLWRFTAIRLIRLYPLYMVGVGLGFIAAVTLGSKSGAPIDGPTLAAATALALLMLPSFSLPALDGPRWSLFYEMVANIAYAATVRWLSSRVLLGVLTASTAVMVAGLAMGGTLDSGWALSHVPIALGRVGYGFFAGVLLYQFHTRTADRGVLIAWLGIVLALLIPAALLVPAGKFGSLAVVLVGFPAIVWIGSRFDAHGAWARLCAFLGVASYAIYILHEPVARLTHAGLLAAGADLSRSRVAGLGMLAALLVVCWLLDRWYDKPVRRWLNGRVRNATLPGWRAGGRARA